MLRLLMHFIDRSAEAIEAGSSVDDVAALPVLRRLRRLGEEMSEETLDESKTIWSEIDDEFAALKGAEEDAR